LINYFKSYSSLGDDRFFVSPCIYIYLHSVVITKTGSKPNL